MLEQFVIAIQIILIDIVMAADNAIIIGLIAANFAPQNKRKIIAWGVAGAFVFRIFFAFGTEYMLEYAWIKIVGGLADITLSFDNVLGVVGAAKDYYYLMITGLLLSVFLVATLATYFANYIKDHKWLGYVGIFVIIIVALQLIIGGLVNLEILTIKEQYEFLFSI